MQTATFLSADHQTNIHYNIWTPETSPRAVLVLFHGMLEYGARYDEFARALNGQGIVVYAHDHLGHGHSMTDPSKRGHFCRPSWQRLRHSRLPAHGRPRPCRLSQLTALFNGPQHGLLPHPSALAPILSANAERRHFDGYRPSAGKSGATRTMDHHRYR